MASARTLPSTAPETAMFRSLTSGSSSARRSSGPTDTGLSRRRPRGYRNRARRRLLLCGGQLGGGSLVLDMTRLDRVIRFAPAEKLVEVEAGMRLEQQLALIAPRGLILPV